MTTRGETKHGARSWTFHPFEVALCGNSGVGKTTLVKRLLAHWAGKYDVAFVKHDAHRFAIDRPGKDTHEVAQAGAAGVLINDPHHFAKVSRLPWSTFERAYAFVDADFVLAEGFKTSSLPKLLLLDTHGQTQAEFLRGGVQNVIALVGTERAPSLAATVPYFHRDDVVAVAEFLERRFLELARVPLYGLVLVGGESRRMGQPKWALRYHGEPQALHMMKLLTQVCERVFLSIRPGQRLDGLESADAIEDRFPAWGPLSGILSAMHRFPRVAWLVAACDLPFLDEATLRKLIAEADPFKIATAYTSASDGKPEPLAAIYQPRAMQRLLQAVGCGVVCPRQTLAESWVKLIALDDPRALDNANTPDEYAAALARLHGRLV